MKRVTLAVLLLAVVGVAACGGDEPAQPAVEVPPWAKVAPEQVAEAKKHGVPVAFENDLGMRFVLIPAGTFLMGSPGAEAFRGAAETQHRVTLTRPYYVQTTEVTNAQYRRFDAKHRTGSGDADKLDGEEQPVGQVPWEDATAFCDWASCQDPQRDYSLPTDAQWEYACRAGTATPFSFGEAISTDQANYNGTPYPCVSLDPSTPSLAKGWNRGVSTRVGSFPANEWGLYDMHGNVWEWCLDWREEDLGPEAVTDPTGPRAGDARVVRGGTWHHDAWNLRSAARRQALPGARVDSLGFRLVSPLPEPPGATR